MSTKALRKRLKDRRVVASVSTGKDSVALSLYLKEQEIEHDRIFLDTKWEAKETAEHLEYLRGKLGPITNLSGPLGRAHSQEGDVPVSSSPFLHRGAQDVSRARLPERDDGCRRRRDQRGRNST